MRRTAAALLLLIAMPALAERRVDLILDLEGVHRTGTNEDTFVPGETRFLPTFQNGGGLGGGIDWYFSDRVSLEGKIAGLATRLRLRTTGSDFVATADLGHAQIYPVSAMLRWHVLDKGAALRPYLQAGVSYIILRNIERNTGFIQEATFKDPVGLALGGGFKLGLSGTWSLTADARYVPLETRARARFGDATAPFQDLDLKPLILGFGVAYSF